MCSVGPLHATAGVYSILHVLWYTYTITPSCSLVWVYVYSFVSLLPAVLFSVGVRKGVLLLFVTAVFAIISKCAGVYH